MTRTARSTFGSVLARPAAESSVSRPKAEQVQAWLKLSVKVFDSGCAVDRKSVLAVCL